MDELLDYYEEQAIERERDAGLSVLVADLLNGTHIRLNQHNQYTVRIPITEKEIVDIRKRILKTEGAVWERVVHNRKDNWYKSRRNRRALRERGVKCQIMSLSV